MISRAPLEKRYRGGAKCCHDVVMHYPHNSILYLLSSGTRTVYITKIIEQSTVYGCFTSRIEKALFKNIHTYLKKFCKVKQRLL